MRWVLAAGPDCGLLCWVRVLPPPLDVKIVFDESGAQIEPAGGAVVAVDVEQDDRRAPLGEQPQAAGQQRVPEAEPLGLWRDPEHVHLAGAIRMDLRPVEA